MSPTEPAPGETELAEAPVYENDPKVCFGYVAGKQATERAALLAAAEGWEVFVLRPGIVYGPRGNWKLSRLGYTAGSRFMIVGKGTTALPSTYVENLAGAVLRAVQAEAACGGIHHIIDDERLTQNEFVQGYRENVAPRLKVCHIPGWLARVLMHCGERAKRFLGGRNPFHRGHIEGCLRQTNYGTRRARTVLGWTPQVPKAEALRRSFAYWAAAFSITRKADLAALGARPKASASRLRVGIVGCGGISDIHVGFLKGIPGVEVVGCFDPVPDKARLLAGKFGLPVAAASLEEFFERARPEAVHILAPPQFAAGLARQCFGRGCHVLVEKPMAVNAEEAVEMARMAAARGLVLGVDHNHLYDRVMVAARRLVESGTLGEITWIDSYYGFDLRGNPGNVLVQPDAGGNWNYSLPGGLFQNLLPHPLSVGLEFMPGPVTVRAIARFFRVLAHQPNDELRLILETPSVCGVVTLSLAASPKAQTLQLYGVKGCAFIDFSLKLLIVQRHFPRLPRPLSRLVAPTCDGAERY